MALLFSVEISTGWERENAPHHNPVSRVELFTAGFWYLPDRTDDREREREIDMFEK